MVVVVVVVVVGARVVVVVVVVVVVAAVVVTGVNWAKTVYQSPKYTFCEFLSLVEAIFIFPYFRCYLNAIFKNSLQNVTAVLNCTAKLTFARFQFFLNNPRGLFACIGFYAVSTLKNGGIIQRKVFLQ